MAFCSESVILKLASYTMNAKEYKALQKSLRYQNHGSTYYQVQRHRTSQLGFGLVDSPVALLAWLGYFTSDLDPTVVSEAAAEGNDKKDIDVKQDQQTKGHIEQYIPYDPYKSTLTADWLLEETFLYWVTKSAATSFLPYATNRLFLEYILDPAYRIDVPFGYSGFPREIIDCPYTWASRYANTSNLTFYALSPTGGHLASSEVPFQFVSHLQTAFASRGRSKFTKPDNAQEYIVNDPKKDANLNKKVFLKEDLNIKGGLWDLERGKDKLNSLSTGSRL